ncbi:MULTISPECIES: Scr1 family TA system antitoxin-like transcriptional regulator [unclassified Streptomyces]|uniref:Scr1 family TA system antitoxin-like transcriptional regulator n=1 Tax=unclassified Streptomyces TaxID=2593676 RepID=UPI0038169280
MSRPRSGPTVALRLFAADLRARREAAGLTIEAAAASLGVHEMTVSRLERAQTAPRTATVTHLLGLYRTPADEARHVLDALDDALRPGWWHPWRSLLPDHLAGVIDLESAAGMIRSYAPGVVPELLQTPGYARALLHLRHPYADEGEIEQRLELLYARQKHTLGRERPPRLWVLMEEAVLTRPVTDDPAVMREQLEALDRHTVRRDFVTVQVIPASAGPHPLLLGGPADILRYDHALLADRLIVRGLHAETATVTDDLGAVRTYQAAMDVTATLALSPTARLPLPKGHAQ